MRDPRRHEVEHVAVDPELAVQRAHRGDRAVVDVGDEADGVVERGRRASRRRGRRSRRGSRRRRSPGSRYAAARSKPKELRCRSEALRELSARVSNWGRWGADDQRGTLNLITPDAVLRGVAAVRTGRVFSLAIPFDADGPQWDNVNMPVRTNPELNTFAVNVSFTGDTADFTTSDDAFTMGSQAATHWDALAHVGYEGKLYNDIDDAVVTAEGGAARLGIENIGPVVTRGVLLDIARLHGVDHFDDNYAITGDDLDRAAAAASVDVRARRRGARAHRADALPAAGREEALLVPVARTLDEHDRVGARPRHRRGRDRHAHVRGLSRARTRRCSCRCT